ncbi:hypothetical protein E2C01_089468 [Portunus trituberculatus]|uniref:Uncharacterized protein n=1 Tax=Portunus trituberculatus TaxID=210409 RepID=A0A5B7JPN8_PORTR|nr:hypothetical protein [Portunus trituberculatus]
MSCFAVCGPGRLCGGPVVLCGALRAVSRPAVRCGALQGEARRAAVGGPGCRVRACGRAAALVGVAGGAGGRVQARGRVDACSSRAEIPQGKHWDHSSTCRHCHHHHHHHHHHTPGAAVGFAPRPRTHPGLVRGGGR